MGLAPVVAAGRLEVDDLHVEIAGFGQGQRLVDGLEHTIGFVADVGRIARALPAQDPPQSDHLLGLGIRAGRGEEARGETERSRVERLIE